MKIFEDLNRIGNIKETPISFDITYNTTIAKLEEKNSKDHTFEGKG